MNKDQQGFKGEKAQHVDGGHLRFSDTKAFGRKTALHTNMQAHISPPHPLAQEWTTLATSFG